MKKIFLILFLGLIALICGPPQRLFASANSNATTVAQKIYFKNTIAGAIASTITNQELSWTKTVAAEQPALPEYTGKTNYFLNNRQFAKIPDSKLFKIIYDNNLKNKLILGFGQRLHQEA